MVRCGLGFLVVLYCCAQSLAISRCNNKIITNIKNFWIGSDIPEKVLETLQQEGLLGLSHSTENYGLNHLKTSDSKCIFGQFTSTQGKFTARSASGKDTSFTFGEKESNGVLIEEGDDILRYIIFSKNGVTPFYICSKTSGNKNGVAAGGLAVAVNKYNDPETMSTVKVTLGLMRSLGIKLTKSYSKTCFKQ